MESSIDIEEVRRRYEEERLRRSDAHRGDLVKLEGDLAHYLDDPYMQPTERAPLTDEVDAIVVGAGFGGLLAAARFKEAGLRTVRVIDRGGDVGGVWYWNRYPGAMCDVESYIYLPLMEETGAEFPPLKYALGPMIYEHAQHVAKFYGLYEHGLFHTGVTKLTWADGAWEVDTDRGDHMRAKYIAVCEGTFSVPKLPDLPGILDFQGHAFHTSRWDYDYTGGDSESVMPNLADKRVAVIGTGATAVQVVPPLGRSAKEVLVFQRTPSTVGPRDQKPTDYSWTETLEPGWQLERMRNFTAIVSGDPVDTDQVQDAWTHIYAELIRNPGTPEMTPEQVKAKMEEIDLRTMEMIRNRVAEVVKDPAKATALQPYYYYLCKRPAFHDEYLQAFNNDNVKIVDTQGRGVEQITEKGLLVDGVEYPVDCIVFATGFEYGTPYHERVGFDIVGRDGLVLSEYWKDGPYTFQGCMTRGFPNLFFMPQSNMQGAMNVDVVHVMTEYTMHWRHIIRHTEAGGHTAFEPSAAAQASWVQTVVDQPRKNIDFQKKCTPSRFNDEGHLEERSPLAQNYPLSTMQFFHMLEEWRRSEGLDGIEFDGRPAEEVVPD
ncbi:flavin-containing monooxygenase [Streptomyces flaveolus]|uniref:flavin-containing monooxygenase n=1 Tax=Streptomyces flaveolus TaxID=67297 RepID=UPI0037F3CC2A